MNIHSHAFDDAHAESPESSMAKFEQNALRMECYLLLIFQRPFHSPIFPPYL